VEAGLTGEVRRVVTEEMSAERFGNPGFPVLGTPALVGLLEAAGIAAIAGSLAADEGSVGTNIAVRHLAATPIGGEVRATAKLITLDGRRLVFSVEASDATQAIAQGEMERFVVNVPRFLAKVRTTPA
jgi:fluoroacetyl-CoA thioesterase